MFTIEGKVVRVTDSSREFLEAVIPEEIPQDTTYVLLSPEGYMFFPEDAPIFDLKGQIHLPRIMSLTYYDIQLESE